jgi:hypothetical protein
MSSVVLEKTTLKRVKYVKSDRYTGSIATGESVSLICNVPVFDSSNVGDGASTPVSAVVFIQEDTNLDGILGLRPCSGCKVTGMSSTNVTIQNITSVPVTNVVAILVLSN